MSRARATALALVNWKGVFFERYLLDQHVTALEGANGAGKTTVMIATYLVLLPDLTRLRFTNLGETAATGGDRGIFGRLGVEGRPSYAALELELGGERVILGVHLERKAEPSVHITTFMVHGLAIEHGLSSLLLLSDGQTESVPELAELKARAAELGARFEGFETLRDYFTALFERGIAPLRLANEDDRAKFNEMLRTSMTGGISRALTSDLGTFLLKEESGLSDTLSRMRQNLDACRRTRLEVQEARALEREISGVYEAGSGMFGAALAAQEAELREAVRRRDSELALEQEARLDSAQADAALGDGLARDEGARQRLAEARARLDAARERREALRRAAELHEREKALADELVPLEAGSQDARARLERAQAAREAAKSELAVAREAYDKAARGLANLQGGLEELHRRAHAYRRGHAALAESRALLGEPELPEDALEAAIERAALELARVDAERTRREREVAGEVRRRDDFARAESALREIAPGADDTDLHALARRELMRLSGLEATARELANLSRQLERAEQARVRREEVRARMTAAGVEYTPGGAARAVEESVAALGRALEQAEERARLLASSRREAEEQAVRLGHELAETQARAERWRRFRALVARLAAPLGGAPTSADDVRVGKERLVGQRETLRARLVALRTERETALATAMRFEHEAGGFAAPLLELCDELGGEFLSARFEDIEVERAARVEAGLGALASAIVVDDVPKALERLRQTGTPFDEVCLVPAGAAVHAEGEPVGERLLAVTSGTGVRVTRLPERPSIGRKAREARHEALLAEAEHLALELERLTADVRRLENAVGDADETLRDAAFAFGPDPGERLLALTEQQRLARSRAETDGAESLGSIAEAAALKQRLEAQRPLLTRAHLLDDDGGIDAETLAHEVRAARAAGAELTRTEQARRVLTEWADALRVPPPSADELARYEAERSELDAERDRWFRAGEALASALATRQARGYAGAEAALDESTRLVPALESELATLASGVAHADETLTRADAQWQEEAARFQEADARRAAVAAQAERLSGEALGLVPDWSPEALAQGEAELARETELALAADREAAPLAEELGTLRERKRQAELALGERRAALAAAEAAIVPLEQRQTGLLAAVRSAGLLVDDLAREPTFARPDVTEGELLAEARSRREVLVDRLLRARGGQTLAEELAQSFASEAEPFAAYVAAWKEVTGWLGRRLPTQVAEVADPLRALERLRDHLALLEERLGRQELDLRGASEDVARGIEVKLRRATTQVRRLNQHLDGISFGSIARIRVEMRRVERMDQILKALREGQAQELLFQSSLPVEEALDEIFRRYGGGKGGGQRLLDYREYLELGVEVERKAKPGFEAVSPTRLSTGEAIGVGAALMMVVLTEWERDANLFRNRRAEGTLRFLFLDEANRLSQDNLGVLFDLCEHLELQLLIAAPEVARAAGNTTYRLVRQVNADGTEEVIVTGRRATQPASESEAPSAEDDESRAERAERTEQLSLMG
jgi:chromosome partition protein MukB